MLTRYVIYFLFPKKRNRFNRLLYTCIHTSNRLLKLGSNFREICLARRVSTARSHPYPPVELFLTIYRLCVYVWM